MSTEEPDEMAYGLVMPFVVCESKGGPYEDQAFVAGYHCGLIDRTLQTAVVPFEETCRTDSLPQFDLIAMHHGWSMKATDSGTSGWSFVRFEPAQTGGSQ